MPPNYQKLSRLTLSKSIVALVMVLSLFTVEKFIRENWIKSKILETLPFLCLAFYLVLLAFSLLVLNQICSDYMNIVKHTLKLVKKLPYKMEFRMSVVIIGGLNDFLRVWILLYKMVFRMSVVIIGVLNDFLGFWGNSLAERIGSNNNDMVKFALICCENMLSFVKSFFSRLGNLLNLVEQPFFTDSFLDFTQKRILYTIIKMSNNNFNNNYNNNNNNYNNNNKPNFNRPNRNNPLKRPHPFDQQSNQNNDNKKFRQYSNNNNNFNHNNNFNPNNNFNSNNNFNPNNHSNPSNQTRNSNPNTSNVSNKDPNKPEPKSKSSNFRSLIVFATLEEAWLSSEDLSKIDAKLNNDMRFVTDQVMLTGSMITSQTKGSSTKMRSEWNCLSFFITMKDFISLIFNSEISIPGTCNKVDSTHEEYSGKAQEFQNQIKSIYGINNVNVNIIIEQYDEDKRAQIRNLYWITANLEAFNIIDLNKISNKFFDNNDKEVRNLSKDNTAVLTLLAVISRKAAYNIGNFARRQIKSNGSESIWATDSDVCQNRVDNNQLMMFERFCAGWNAVKTDNNNVSNSMNVQ